MGAHDCISEIFIHIFKKTIAAFQKRKNWQQSKTLLQTLHFVATVNQRQSYSTFL